MHCECVSIIFWNYIRLVRLVCALFFLLWRISLFWMARSMTREEQKMNIRNKIVSIEISKANVARRRAHSIVRSLNLLACVCVWIAEK